MKTQEQEHGDDFKFKELSILDIEIITRDDDVFFKKSDKKKDHKQKTIGDMEAIKNNLK